LPLSGEGTKFLMLGNASLFFWLPRMHEFFTLRFWVLPRITRIARIFKKATLFGVLPRIRHGGQVGRI